MHLHSWNTFGISVKTNAGHLLLFSSSVPSLISLRLAGETLAKRRSHWVRVFRGLRVTVWNMMNSTSFHPVRFEPFNACAFTFTGICQCIVLLSANIRTSDTYEKAFRHQIDPPFPLTLIIQINLNWPIFLVQLLRKCWRQMKALSLNVIRNRCFRRMRTKSSKDDHGWHFFKITELLSYMTWLFVNIWYPNMGSFHWRETDGLLSSNIAWFLSS